MHCMRLSLGIVTKASACSKAELQLISFAGPHKQSDSMAYWHLVCAARVASAQLSVQVPVSVLSQLLLFRRATCGRPIRSYLILL